MLGGTEAEPLEIVIQWLVRATVWAAAIGLGVVAYELLRASLLRGVRIRLERSVSRYLRRHQVRLDRYKFTQKHYIRESLLADVALNEFMTERARIEQLPVTELGLRVDEYIAEIVPQFNLVSYYKFGYGLARPLMRLLYSVQYSPANLAAVEASLRPGVATVYVMNHRSNADYVLFAVCMSKRVALSYAVGEWARVWPLEFLFKSFGSYFVRRGEKDPLYHKVLERYIQLVSLGGLTQGIFIEGGLSRDGHFRSPKVGLIDSLLGVTDGDGDVQFVPVGLNFDRVLEDRNLLEEATGTAAAPSAASKLRSLAWLLVTVPRAAVSRAVGLLVGVWKVARRRSVGFGVAAVHAGEPISLRALLEGELEGLKALPRKERRVRLEQLGDELMRRIGAEVPVTAVPLAARALLTCGAATGVPEAAVRKAIEELLAVLRGRGAPVLLGPAFAELRSERAALEDEASGSGRPLLDLTGDLLAGEEAQRVWETARAMLAPRGVFASSEGEVKLLATRRDLVEYYAASLDGHGLPPLERPPRA